MLNPPSKLLPKSEVPRPILKWAGGKSQMLEQLLPKVPENYGKYIEPFFGGGALFFALRPETAVIADSNSELINLYQVVRDKIQDLIKELSKFSNNSELFYEVRALKFEDLTNIKAAARTIFLNKTCFNGLYRVNKLGGFNVPFGNYKNPKICDENSLNLASKLLKNKQIILGDYLEVLRNTAKENDLIFLDPPYLPISQYSDFKRYTKEQFYEEDHVKLSEEVKRLQDIGCHVVLTNSNHPLVHDLYKKFQIEIIQTKRFINSDSSKRTGEDIIVTVKPKKVTQKRIKSTSLNTQIDNYPSTRYMGSKNKLLPQIWSVASQFEHESVLDLFSGSGIVSYMFKSQGKQVFSNDYMAMASAYSMAMIENNSVILSDKDILKLIEKNKNSDMFVSKTFKDLYFTDEENLLIDNIRENIKKFRSPYKKAIAKSALIRACIKKRPRGIFTYTGHRYDDGRRDLLKTLQEQFIEAIKIINSSIFDNIKENKSIRGDALSCKLDADLVYIDPPYYSLLSDNEYVRRYHFVEGLACDWKDVEIQWHTSTRKFKSYPTPFSSRKGAESAFNELFEKYKSKILLVSYSSNSLPTLDEMTGIMSNFKKVEVLKVDYKYSFGNQAHKILDNKNKAQEYLFLGY
jgi:DNA adenine methylase